MGYDGRVVFKVDLDTKDFVPQIEQTKKELDDLLVEYEEIQKPLDGTTNTLMAGGKAAKYQNEQLTKMAAKIQELANKYIDLKQKQDDVYKTNMKSVKNIGMMDNAAYNKSYALQYNQLGNSMAKVSGELPYVADGFKDIGKEAEFAGDETADAGKKAQTSGKLFDKGFSKGLKSVKRLALGIVGIRGAYMLARKAAASYMAQDEDLAKSMQSVWTGLGAFLAPLLETLSQLMLKFVGYLNVFIKALTGKDLIASANAKILEKQAKAQEKLNKATKEYQNYDFDVIRTQQTDTSSASGSGSDEASLINIPELNQNIVKKLEDLAKWLKENKDLIEAVGIALGITFGAVAIGNLLANIAALIGSGTLMTGLLGLLAILSLVAIVWTIKLVIDGLDELYEALDISKELRKNLKENTPPIEAMTEHEQSMGWLYESMNAAESVRKTMSGFGGGVLHAVSFGKTTKKLKEELHETYAEMGLQVKRLVQAGKEGKLTIDGYKQLSKFVEEYGDNLNVVNEYVEGEKITLNELNEAMNSYTEQVAKSDPVIQHFNSLTKEQQKQLEKVYAQYLLGTIKAEDYFDAVSKIPSIVKTNVNIVGIEQATKDAASYVKNALDKIPLTRTTTIKVEKKEAETNTDNLITKLTKIPNSVWTTIKATLDTTEADRKANEFLNKINLLGIGTSVMQSFKKLIGFAGGGYVSQPTFAMVGEGKYNEYVIPDGEDYISRLANEIGKYGTGGNGTVNVYLDGRLIQRQVDNTRNNVNFVKNR